MHPEFEPSEAGVEAAPVQATGAMQAGLKAGDAGAAKSRFLSHDVYIMRFPGS